MTRPRTSLRAFGLLTALVPGPLAAQGIPMDTASFHWGRYAEADALLEKTIFRVDVARLRLRFGAETASGLEELLDGAQGSEQLADTVAGLAIHTLDAWAGLTFQRNVGFDRFLAGIRDGVKVARDAGLIDPVFARSLSDSLPVWYASLRERGVRDGDVMMYRIRGDTLRTVFRTVDGQVLVDQVDTGPQPRLSVMGGILAPGSDFRKGLLNSLWVAKTPSEQGEGPRVAQRRYAEG
jgi:hypothetical protein